MTHQVIQKFKMVWQKQWESDPLECLFDTLPKRLIWYPANIVLWKYLRQGFHYLSILLVLQYLFISGTPGRTDC